MASHKRPAPPDFPSSASPGRPPPAHRNSGNSTAPTEDNAGALVAVGSSRGGYAAAAAAQEWADELGGRIEAVEQTQGEEGRVVLEMDEARSLLGTLQETVAGFLETPATRGDIFVLMAQLSAATGVAPIAPPALPSHRSRRRSSRPAKPSIASNLPFDVLSLILVHLRTLYAEEQDADSLFGRRSGVWHFWQGLRGLALVSPRWKEACHALYRRQLHIVDIKQLPERAAYLAKKPHRAEALRELTLQCYDFEYAFGRSSEDAGFAIPELVERATNLTSLSITADRPSAYSNSSVFRGRRQRFETLTGGINLPSIITHRLTSLRALSYGAPTTLADVLKFATEIPTLQTLDILGEVDHAVVPAGGFKPCSRSLRRLWLPSTALTADQLETLLLGPGGAMDDLARPRITSLAFAFDAEQQFSPTAPTDDEVIREIAQLVALFSVIGEQLRELQVSTPGADQPDPANGLFGGGAAANGWVPLGAFVVHGAAGPAPAPAGGPPPAPQPRGTGQPQAGQAGGAGASNAGGLGGAGAGGAGGAGAGAGLFGGGNNPFITIRLAAPAPPTPFFDSLIARTPNLEHVELFGRRYADEVIPLLANLPLRHLALSVPVESMHEKVVGDLLEVLEKGSWPSLRRLELSGRGGLWAPGERRKVKQAVEAKGAVYKSTDTKA
ncbi:hypothetical protein JCM10213_004646 [Rhodosporidiobolus nylandii]